MASSDNNLKAGDLVRVRSREVIGASLSEQRELSGCAFTSEMWQYCGTEQRVLKRMEIFLDEQTYRRKKASGIVILEGLFCQGTAFPEGCDRSCFFLWREEWLEKIG